MPAALGAASLSSDGKLRNMSGFGYLPIMNLKFNASLTQQVQVA